MAEGVDPSSKAKTITIRIHDSRIQIGSATERCLPLRSSGARCYGLVLLYLILRSVGAQTLSRLISLPVSLLGRDDLFAVVRSYKHLAPLERKQKRLRHAAVQYGMPVAFLSLLS